MEGNAFVELAAAIKPKDEASIVYLGKVLSLSPFCIDLAGTIQQGTDLLRNPDIRDLENGDQVLMISVNCNQQFVVVCKVV
ncbi:hypothetical protein [Anaeromassilibacillus senegalensis]|uniref:hypothetical protein n=1 Tax=Anaeromassilibacillus senegalensis TaxID=1673717 RepID=UPI00067F8F93|nr:hypothetical protein [Anaeromassilibacillus senegalensis]